MIFLKKDIIKLLKSSKNEFISGEYISQNLGVSRAAIWKYMNALKEEGYIIDSVSKKGYKLISSPDLLTYIEIEEYLNTKYIGRNIEHFHEIDSTNTKAKELARNGAPEGTLVLSEYQSAGRGRLGRNWSSPKNKGIWMSLILRPNIDPIYASKTTLIGAAAVHNALKALDINDVKIKWPNDLLLNKKKVCGILTEMSGELNQINYIIMGIGINVNVEEEEFPKELSPIATSLKIESRKYVDRKVLLAHILNNFEKLYDDFIRNNSLESTLNICRNNSILLGKEIQCINRNEVFTAKALDLNEEGELVVELEDGSIKNIISGEVSIRGLYGYIDD